MTRFQVAATDVSNVDVDLGVAGAGDGSADSVTANGESVTNVP